MTAPMPGTWPDILAEIAAAARVGASDPGSADIATLGEIWALLDHGRQNVGPDIPARALAVRAALVEDRLGRSCGCRECCAAAAAWIERWGAYRCGTCGYRGESGTVECQCYEDWAVSCRPGASGPGCPHGVMTCPVCGDGALDDEYADDAADVLVEILDDVARAAEGSLPWVPDPGVGGDVAARCASWAGIGDLAPDRRFAEDAAALAQTWGIALVAALWNAGALVPLGCPSACVEDVVAGRAPRIVRRALPATQACEEWWTGRRYVVEPWECPVGEQHASLHGAPLIATMVRVGVLEPGADPVMVLHQLLS